MKKFILTLSILSAFMYGSAAQADDFDPADADFSKIAVTGTKDTSAYYNQKGLDQYRKGNIRNASAYFFYAVKKNPSDKFAHYNFACMLSLLRKGKSVCDTMYVDRIEAHLETSISLDAERREKMIRDKDLLNVREYPFFTRLTLDPSKPILKLLCDTETWYGPKPGVFPSSPEIKFSEDGRFRIRYFNAAGERDPGFMPWEKGRFTIQGNTILLKYDNPERKNRTGVITIKTGKGIVKEFTIDFADQEIMSLDPDECSA
jgi:hypothetical protein